MFNNFNQYSQPMQGNFSGNSTMTSQQPSRYVPQYNSNIIRVTQHLTVAVYGNVLDIWDCSDEPVDCY